MGRGSSALTVRPKLKVVYSEKKIHFQFQKKIRESHFRGKLPKTTKIRDFPLNAHSQLNGNTKSVVTFTLRTFYLCCPDSKEVFSFVQMISWTLLLQKIAHQNASTLVSGGLPPIISEIKINQS